MRKENFKKFIVFKSDRNFFYLYSPVQNRIQLISPILAYILELEESNKGEIKQWIRNTGSKKVIIKGLGYIDKRDLQYYYSKFLFFKKNKFLDGYVIRNRIKKRITENDVKRVLANVDTVGFEVTERCNLDCKYCTYGDLYIKNEKRRNRDLNIELAKNILKTLNKFRFSNLNLSKNRSYSIGFYGGEPLLNFPLIEEIVNFAQRNKRESQEINFNITTNAILINKHLDFLVKHDFRILISIDGSFNNNSYRCFPNGKPSFNQVRNNIKLIKKKYPDFFRRNIEFNSVIHKKNSIQEIYYFFKKEFEKIPRISEVSPIWIDPKMKNKFKEIFKITKKEVIRPAIKKQIEREMRLYLPYMKDINFFVLVYSGFVFREYFDLFYKDDLSPIIPTGTCIPFAKKIFITVGGEILPCENVGYIHYLDILDKKNPEINFEKIAKRYNKFLEMAVVECNHCYWVNRCQICMFTFLSEGIIKNCYGFKTKSQFQSYLAYFISILEKNPQFYTENLSI